MPPLTYLLPCECGKKISVVQSDSGASIACECGRPMIVPSLSQLRELPTVPRQYSREELTDSGNLFKTPPREQWDEARWHHLRSVAHYQHGILYCILLRILCLIAAYLVPADWRLVVVAVELFVDLASLYYIIFLIHELGQSRVAAITYAILAIVPCLGVVILLMFNQQATELLKKHGIHVGLMGARRADLA